MLVGFRMTKEPVTVAPGDLLSDAERKMKAGGFRRLPVVSNGKLMGIVTERDLREHRGHLERTRINGVMTENPITVAPNTVLEDAAQIMLKQQIGGLPVVEGGQLIGIITASDVMHAFLDMMGASNGGSVRLDFRLEGEEHGFIEASRIVAREGGEVLGVGSYRDKPGENSICYLRLLSGDAERIAGALRVSGFDVLGVHRMSREAK
jgi:acetoin utilization protein AcuB